MADLITFLRAQLDADEQAARGTGVVAWLTFRSPPSGDMQYTAVASGGPDVWIVDGKEATGWDSVVVIYDESRVLAEVEAKRRILELHVLTVEPVDVVDPLVPETSVTCEICGWASEDSTSACLTVRLLALPFSDRPGYDETWRPA